MNAAVQTLLGELLGRPGVALVEGDMMGERSLTLDGREILHVHGNSLLHIMLPKDVKEAALAEGRARQHPYAPRSGMVELSLRSEDGLPRVRSLVETAFEFAQSRGPRPVRG